MVHVNQCKECGVETKNLKFCSRSCAAKKNNRENPKRQPQGRCYCGVAINANRKRCVDCRRKFLNPEPSEYMTCTKCGETKPTNMFARNSKTKLGVGKQCKLCRSNYQNDYWKRNPDQLDKNVKRNNRSNWERHHITKEQYDSLMRSANGLCSACKSSPATCIDHDHSCCKSSTSSCGKCVRGVLCHKCNLALGSLRDDPQIIMGLYNYIKGHKH